MHLLYDLYYALMPIPISPMLALFVVLTKSVSASKGSAALLP